MAKIKVAIVGTVGKSVAIDPNATVGSTLGTDFRLPDGSIATVSSLAELLGVTPGGAGEAGIRDHRLLRGLKLGDDHPQYVRKDTLTTRGDLYIRNGTTVTRLPLGPVDQILRSDGTDAEWYDADANPTASVGLTPVNGSANTFMRSDAAPALDQGIAPTWTGVHTFSLAPYVGITAAEIAGIPGLPLASPGITIQNSPFVLGVAAGVRYNAARVNGTLAAPTAMATGQTMCAFAGFGYDGTTMAEAGGVFVVANSAWTNTSHSTRLDLHTVADGSIVPLSSATVRATLGANATGAWFRMGVTANGGDGTAAQPALSWSSDTDTGIYRIGADALGFSTGGALRVDVNTTRVQSGLPIYVNPNSLTIPAAAIAADVGVLLANSAAIAFQQIAIGAPLSLGNRFISAAGTFSVPTAVNVTDINYMAYMGAGGFDGTNWQTGSASLVGIRPSGTWSSTSRPTRITFEVTAVGSTVRTLRAELKDAGQFALSDGSPTVPGISFLSDTDTGMHRPASNQLGFSAAGVTGLLLAGANGALTLGAAGATPNHAINVETATTANVGAASALPALPVGYVRVLINGTMRKIPYYAD